MQAVFVGQRDIDRDDVGGQFGDGVPGGGGTIDEAGQHDVGVAAQGGGQAQPGQRRITDQK